MEEYAYAADFFGRAVTQALGQAPENIQILDLGCGSGELVKLLSDRGFDAFGADVGGEYAHLHVEEDRLRRIELNPYHLPFDDASFAAVISFQVLEHVKDKAATLAEIHRVLRPGGITLHVFPSKWTPIEVHLFVPFLSWLWPKVPRAWLSFWALLGVRNQYQRKMAWRRVVADNAHYCDVAIDYQTVGTYCTLFTKIFGNFDSPMRSYILNTDTRKSRLMRKLPLLGVTSALSGIFQQRVVFARKLDGA